MSVQSDLERLPVRPSDASLRNLMNLFGFGAESFQKMGAYILANIAALVRSTITVAGTITRPADTTAYASGDLVANSTTAGSVVPVSLKVARNSAGSATIERVRLSKSGAVLTNASFRVHLYSTSPTPTNGDNGVWLTTISGYLGSFDVTIDRAFSVGSQGAGVPNIGTSIPVSADADGTVFALLEARAAYTPASAEVFTVTLEARQS